MAASIAGITIASNFGLLQSNCTKGPLHIKKAIQNSDLSTSVKWLPTVHQTAHLNHSALIQSTYSAVKHCFKHYKQFLLFGGDHSCAIGSWPAIIDQVGTENFGLIWLDAHLDAHNFQTSHSGNLHGMPVQALLKTGDPQLARLYPGKQHIQPDNLFIIGARSYEPEEKYFLQQRGANIIFNHQLTNTKQIEDHLENTLSTLQHCQYLGVSIDLDILNPNQFPAVSAAAPNGISFEQLALIISLLKKNQQTIGFEFSEYNPAKDHRQQSLKLFLELVRIIVDDSSY